MISIIVCSVNEQWRNELTKNIADTINYPFEFLFVDNKGSENGICHVYNKLASEAKGDYLCFCHEDITFNSHSWGQELANFASNKQVGLIGFAGSGYMNEYPFWCNKYDFKIHLVQCNKKRELIGDHTKPKPTNFSEVIVLDGMLLFCRKDVWAKNKFDDKLFSGFHMYDMDFSFATSLYYKNYVCNTISITHYSLGNANQTYFDSLNVFIDKWNNNMPRSIRKYSKLEEIKNTHTAVRKTFREIIKKNNLPLSSALLFFQNNSKRSFLDKIFIYQYWLKYKLKSR